MYYRNEKQKTFQLFLLVVITVILTVIFIAPRCANAQLIVKMLDVAQGLFFFTQNVSFSIIENVKLGAFL